MGPGCEGSRRALDDWEKGLSPMMQGQEIEKTEKQKNEELTGCYAVSQGNIHTLSDIDGIKAVLLLAVEG